MSRFCSASVNVYETVVPQRDSSVNGFSADSSTCVLFVSMPLSPDDQHAREAGRIETPGLRTVLPEVAVRVTIAEREDEAVLAEDARDRGAGVPVAEAIAHAEAELVGVGHLEIVVDEVDFARRAVEQRLQIADGIAGEGRIPVHAA